MAASSKFDVGSSSTRFAGWGAHELAYAMRCFSPPDSEKMLRSASSSNPSWRMVSCVRSRMRSSGHAMLSSENATSPVESTLKNCVRGFWNTEPTHAATSQLSRSATSRPSTSTRPSSVPGRTRAPTRSPASSPWSCRSRTRRTRARTGPPPRAGRCRAPPRARPRLPQARGTRSSHRQTRSSSRPHFPTPNRLHASAATTTATPAATSSPSDARNSICV